MADQVAAAIRRASQAARNQMRALDAEAAGELERIYSAAAEQVRGAIARAAGAGQRVQVAQLRELLATIEAVLSDLTVEREALVEQAMRQAAELGVRPLTTAGIAATGRTVAPVVADGAALQVVDAAVAFVRAFRAEDGLVLSDRLWRLDRGAREAVGRAVEQAVVRGWSADKAAAELIMRGQPVPAATAAAQAGAEVGQVLRAADLLKAPGGPQDAALRVMRTEINRAHGEAYAAGAEGAPGFVGFRFLLSPRHPKPDICDLLASQNLHGLGQGVYPTRKATPWPAHPNTLSFIVAVFEDEVTPEDRAGQETPNEALARMAPELRAGVLGPTKATYFDQGLLTRGMLRSRVRDVQARLTRQGRI